MSIVYRRLMLDLLLGLQQTALDHRQQHWVAVVDKSDGRESDQWYVVLGHLALAKGELDDGGMVVEEDFMVVDEKSAAYFSGLSCRVASTVALVLNTIMDPRRVDFDVDWSKVYPYVEMLNPTIDW